MMNEFTGEAIGRKSIQVPILDQDLTAELTGDFSLPDYHPEIKRLLRIGTNVLPPNRYVGSDGVELNGTMDYYALYVGHDNGVYCAPLSTEYRIKAEPDAEGRNLPATAGESPVCLCDTFADPPIGRVTAPRRLNIRCKLHANVKLYGECPTDDGTAEEGDKDTESLIEEAVVNRVYEGLGDPLPLQDDLILAPSDREWRVVCAEGQVLVTEAIPSAGAVNCHGEVTLKLTLCSAETEVEFASDTVDGRTALPLTVMQRKIPFTQTVDVDGVTPSCSAAACGYCTDISVEMEEGHVHVDMHVILDTRAQKNETAAYVKDQFSTRRESLCRYTPLPTESALRTLNGNFTLNDSLPLSEVGVDPAAKVADVTVSAAPDNLTADAAKGRCVLTGICLCHLILLRDGEYTPAEISLPFRYEFDDPSLIRLASENSAPSPDEDASALTPSLGFDGKITAINCRARMDGERVGVDAELAVFLRTYRVAPLTALTDVSFGEEVTRRRGEYVICFPSPTDTVWSVAKRYHAPLAALTAANNLPTGAKTDDRESLDGIGYLIV